MSRSSILPEQFPLVVLAPGPGGGLPRPMGTNPVSWMTWLVLAAAVALHLLLGPDPRPASLAQYLRAIESPVPEWVHWVCNGLLAALKVLIFTGFVFGRKFPCFALLGVAGLAVATWALEEPLAWGWAVAALLLLPVVGFDAVQRARQLRFMSPPDAQRVWLPPAQLPTGHQRLLPGRIHLAVLGLGCVAVLASALLLDSPYAGHLEALILKGNENPLDAWTLTMLAVGSLMACHGLFAVLWRLGVEPRTGRLGLDWGKAIPTRSLRWSNSRFPRCRWTRPGAPAAAPVTRAWTSRCRTAHGPRSGRRRTARYTARGT